jgi:hypothetical protein
MLHATNAANDSIMALNKKFITANPLKSDVAAIPDSNTIFISMYSFHFYLAIMARAQTENTIVQFLT